MSFDPTEHVKPLKAGSTQMYMQVAPRLLWINDYCDEHGYTFVIETELVDKDHSKPDNRWYMFKATVSMFKPPCPEDDGYGFGPIVKKASGHGSCDDRAFKQGASEKAETKATGRALNACGFGTGFALEKDDVEEEGVLAEAPVDADPATIAAEIKKIVGRDQMKLSEWQEYFKSAGLRVPSSAAEMTAIRLHALKGYLQKNPPSKAS